MTFSAYNASLAIHLLNVFDDPHHARKAQAAQQSDAAPIELVPVEDAIWREIPQIAPPVAEDQV